MSLETQGLFILARDLYSFLIVSFDAHINCSGCLKLLKPCVLICLLFLEHLIAFWSKMFWVYSVSSLFQVWDLMLFPGDLKTGDVTGGLLCLNPLCKHS